MRSKNLTTEHWEAYCESVFEKPLKAKVDHWNLRFGGKHPMSSKIIYTNGGDDPWRGASILPGENESADIVLIDIDCDDCAHCVDLKAPTPEDPEVLQNA